MVGFRKNPRGASRGLLTLAKVFIPDPCLNRRPIVSGFSSGTGFFPGFFTNRPDAPLQGLGGKVEIRLCCRKNFPSSLRQVDRFWKETAKETCNFVGSVTLTGKNVAR